MHTSYQTFLGRGFLYINDRVLSPFLEDFAFLEIVHCPKITVLRLFWCCSAFGFVFAQLYVERWWQKMFSTISEFIIWGMIKTFMFTLLNRPEQSSLKRSKRDSISSIHWLDIRQLYLVYDGNDCFCIPSLYSWNHESTCCKSFNFSSSRLITCLLSLEIRTNFEVCCRSLMGPFKLIPFFPSAL